MPARHARRHPVVAFCAIAATVAATLAATLAGAPASADPGKPVIRGAGAADAIPGSYIVVLKDARTARTAVGATARTLTGRSGGTVARTYTTALRGFEARLGTGAAERLAADPTVAYVAQNRRVQIQDTQLTPPSWGLDRVDQRTLPLDTTYSYPQSADGVHAYIIDTGVSYGHREFGGRAVSGFDAVDGGSADDCNGHGTHVAGTVGGTTYGLAKKVTLVGVRVLDCGGSGSYAGVLAGVDWVTAHAVRPAVANMSLGGGADETVDAAVRASVASGVSYAIAAGNSAADACNSTPARVTDALTVAASTIADGSAGFTNRGRCVDLYAPGASIVSAWHTGDTATRTLDGTSMAAPHVAGVAALYLDAHPQWSPAQVHAAVVDAATPGAVTGVPAGTANRLLYSGEVLPPADDFSVTAAPAAATVTAGGAVTGTVATATIRGLEQRVRLAVSGLPSGATATFDPAAITSGGSAALTVQTAPTTPAGRYDVAVTAVGTGVARSASLALTVTGAPGCSGADASPVSIPDAGAPVFSTITIHGCDRAASAAATVTVDISHSWRGDVVLDLVAPDGSTYRLKEAAGPDSADDIRDTYPVDLSAESAQGDWRLRAQDVAAIDVGAIRTWALTL